MRIDVVRAIWLGLVSGTADAAGWLGGGVFPAHMTGNTVLLGVSALEGRWHLFGVRFATIACFFAGLLLAAALHGRKRGGTTEAVLGAASFALAAAVVRAPPADVLLLAVALAMQNATLRRFGGVDVNTSFLTGDLQSLAMALVRGVRGDASSADKDRVVLRVVPAIWCAYVGGACIGACLDARLHHPLLAVSLAIPVVLLLLGREER